MGVFLVTLGVVYGAGLVWNFVRSGGATWQFDWPLVAVRKAYASLQEPTQKDGGE